MVAAIQTEPTFRSQPPRVLFETRFGGDELGTYDVSADGQRFVAVQGDKEEPEPLQIVVIPDFAEELKAKMAEAGQQANRSPAWNTYGDLPEQPLTPFCVDCLPPLCHHLIPTQTISVVLALTRFL